MKNIKSDAEMRQLIREAAVALDRLERYSVKKESEDIRRNSATTGGMLLSSLLTATVGNTPDFQRVKNLIRVLDAMYEM